MTQQRLNKVFIFGSTGGLLEATFLRSNWNSTATLSNQSSSSFYCERRPATMYDLSNPLNSKPTQEEQFGRAVLF